MSEHKNFPPSAYISFSEIKDGETFSFRYGDRDNVLLSTLLHKQAIFLKVTGNTFDEAEKMAHEWLMNFSDKHKLHSAK